jgi:hypothetical protein
MPVGVVCVKFSKLVIAGGALSTYWKRNIWVAASGRGWQHRGCGPVLFLTRIESSCWGEVPERSNGAVSKTVVPLTGDRGFESLPLRQPPSRPARRDTDAFASWMKKQRRTTPPLQVFLDFRHQAGGVTGSPSRGARRDRGRSMGWRLKALDPEEPAAWRSYPLGGGPALPGSVGWRCLRPFETEDVLSFHGGALKPVHAGALAASPMWSPQGPHREPPRGLSLRANPGTPTAAYRAGQEIPSADWTAAKRGQDPPGD